MQHVRSLLDSATFRSHKKFIIHPEYVQWLLNPVPLRLLGYSSSTWYRKTQGFKHIKPNPMKTSETHEYIMLDATYLPYGLCIITAFSSGYVLDWQWAGSENSTAYAQLLKRLPAPRLAITDGNAAALSAIRA